MNHYESFSNGLIIGTLWGLAIGLACGASVYLFVRALK